MEKDPKADPKVQKRLKDARKAAGFETAEAFAEKANISDVTYRAYENGTRRLTEIRARKIAPYLSVSWLWLTDGIAEEEHSDEYETIKAYDIQASAGPGRTFSEENVKYNLPFRREWLKSITVASTDKLALVDVSGDSMEPTLSDGDIVLIDTSQTNPLKDGIYYISYDSEGLVKRLQYNPATKKIEVISDNEKYRPFTVPKEAPFKVLGKVLWKAGRV